jgi:Xaa-Pro dipeptidase
VDGRHPPVRAGVRAVESPRSTHILSSWDEGIPPEIPFDHLYGVTWNGAVLAGALAGIPGLAAASRIGVEAQSPGIERMVRRLAPEAAHVPADDLIRAVRALKLPAEVARIRAAVAVARAGMEAAGGAVADGAGPTVVRAAALAAVAGLGVTVPTSGVAVTQPDPGAGCAAHVDIGLLVDGYEGGLGRTLPEADGAAAAAAQRRLVDACRPGATVADLREAVAAGVSRWAVRGSGMGFEIPVMTAALGRGQVIEEHMVLSVGIELDGERRRDLAVVAGAATEIV